MAAVAELKQMLRTLQMTKTVDIVEEILMDAQTQRMSYVDLLTKVLGHEVKCREEKRLEGRLKKACLPQYKTLEEFDINEQPSLEKKQLKQLTELLWLEQAYNLILLGPPGVGKTHVAIGLGIEAIKQGYRVSFVQMDELIRLLKTQEITRNSRARLRYIMDSDLVIIDDLTFIAMEKHEANLFFQLVNKLYGDTSIIVTSNKGPEDWGELLGDVAITTAILDRIVHKCEVIQLKGDSYRLKHRQSIFGTN